MDHAREVHSHLGVEDRRAHRPAGVDDREHRRRDDVVKPRRAGRLGIEVQGIGLTHRVGVLADLLAPDRVGRGGVGLADGGGVSDIGAESMRAPGQMMTGTAPPSTDHAAPATLEAACEQRNTITVCDLLGSGQALDRQAGCRRLEHLVAGAAARRPRSGRRGRPARAIARWPQGRG